MADRPSTEPGTPTALDRELRAGIGQLTDGQRLQLMVEKHSEALERGAHSFVELRQENRELRRELHDGIKEIKEAIAPQPLNAWGLAAKIVPFVIVIAGFVWAFAKYPDRVEFTNKISETRSKVERVQEQVNALQLEQVRAQSTQAQILKAVEGQGKKLDAALEDDRQTRRARRR